MGKLTLYSELLVTRFSRTFQSPLPRKLRWRIWKTHLGLMRRRVLGGGRTVKRVPVLGHRVATYSMRQLQIVFEELFIFLSYYFTPKRTPPFILDCGSNIGMSILFFKTLFPDATIVGFEPAEPVFKLLQENIEGLADVEVHPYAVGRDEGEIDFYLDPDDPGSMITTTMPSRELKERTKVRQVRLSGYVDRDVDLLKLDVEGAEDAVLEDLVESGAIDRIDQMVIEYHHHIDADRDAFSQFLAQLEKSGFGYQIGGSCPPGVKRDRGRSCQDIHIFAYRK